MIYLFYFILGFLLFSVISYIQDKKTFIEAVRNMKMFIFHVFGLLLKINSLIWRKVTKKELVFLSQIQLQLLKVEIISPIYHLIDYEMSSLIHNIQINRKIDQKVLDVNNPVEFSLLRETFLIPLKKRLIDEIESISIDNDNNIVWFLDRDDNLVTRKSIKYDTTNASLWYIKSYIDRCFREEVELFILKRYIEKIHSRKNINTMEKATKLIKVY